MENSSYIKSLSLLDNYDLLLLSYLYKYKVLSVETCWISSYAGLYPDFSSCFQARIAPLIANQIVSYQPDARFQYVIMLTGKGQDLLRMSQGLDRYYEDKNGKIKRTLLKPSENAVKESQIPHQAALSDFLIRFSLKYYHDYAEKIEEGSSLITEVEEPVGRYEYFRPDGILRIPGLTIFVEQDMGSETRYMLTEKWDEYQRYLAAIAGTEEYTDQKIVVPFIETCPSSYFQTRCDVIRRTMEPVFFEMLDGKFEVFLGTEEEMLSAMFERVLPDFFGASIRLDPIRTRFMQEGFKVSDGEKIAPQISGTKFDFFIQKTCSGKIIEENGVIQAYAVDDYDHYPCSVLAKAGHLGRISSLFELAYRSIPLNYMILASDPERLRRDLAAIGVKEGNHLFIRKKEKTGG